MARKGYSAFADLIRRTADGRDVNELFAELQAAVDLQNADMDSFLSLFTYQTTSPVASVLQSVGGGGDVFEDASEYGVPESSRAQHNTLNMGATFQWRDARWACSWRYLADASASEVEANANAILAADEEKVFAEVMATVFRHTNRQVTDTRTGSVYDVFAFANGDGWTPPDYQGQSFSPSHTHYRVSGAATITSGDLDEIVDDFTSHGYSAENGTQVVIFVNAAEANVISTFRVASGARSDFVASAGSRFFANEGDLIGTQPAATFAGFPVKGAYDDALIVESSRIPAGYVAALASGGRLANSNPIMFRTHRQFPGLTLIEGARPAYPLVDSYWTRGFGTGVRHRLAGVVMQIKASGSYSPPSLYVPA